MTFIIKLTDTVIEQIASGVREGCYATVAAQRAGVNHWVFYTWQKRGEREAQEREEGSPAAASVYEQLYHAIEQAKAEARYRAETRVLRLSPQWWLSHGYARDSWRESDQLVRIIEDAVEAKLREREERLAERARKEAYNESMAASMVGQEEYRRLLQVHHGDHDAAEMAYRRWERERKGDASNGRHPDG